MRLNIAVPPPGGISSLDSPQEMKLRRESLGIAADQFIIGRLGRNDVSKWNRNSESFINTLLEKVPQASWVSIGLPKAYGAQRLSGRWGKRFVNFDETSDYNRLCNILSCLDTQVFFSQSGECFAFSIAEAASVAVPTIALCTPSRDNGQAEQIIEGESGHLIANAEDAAAVLRKVVADPSDLCE